MAHYSSKNYSLNLALIQYDYLTRIQKAIFRKRRKLLKKALIDGQNLAVKEYHPFLDNLDKMAHKIHIAKIDYIIARAEVIIEEHLRLKPDAIVTITLNLLKNIAEHTDVELTAHKSDAQLINESLNEITTAHASGRKITILEDDTFKRGSLVIKAHKSILDAHVKTQLNRAKEILLMCKE
jgi:flagellar biosynthesis/type III secretory pathway protein FliH